MSLDMAKLKKAIRHPIKAIKYIVLRFWGEYYRVKYCVFMGKADIGSGLKVKPKLSIKGPGKVSIGKNVLIDGTSHAVTLWTYHPDAEIIVGDNVFLNSTRFGCRKRIEIGDNSIIADCRILDTDFHSIYPERRNDPSSIRSSPIKIGDNVWVAMACIILPGVSIGDNSTIAAGSVVTEAVPNGSLSGGNPCRVIRRIENK